MKRYERTADELVQEIAMMSDPSRWPMLVLPVKRMAQDGGVPEMGYLIGTPRVYLGNIFDAKESDPFLDYPNYTTLVADGWVVD